MRIYIDFDDVLCETARYMAQLAHLLFGRQVSYEQISHFNLQKTFDLSCQEINLLMEHAHTPEELLKIEPVVGSIGSIEVLQEQYGCEVMIVTGRPATSYIGSLAWLEKHGLACLPLIHLDKYGRIFEQSPVSHQPHTYTLSEFAQYDFDIAIEDAPAALEILAQRQQCQVLVFDRPWNQGYQTAANMQRVFSWTDICTYVACATWACRADKEKSARSLSTQSAASKF